MGPKQLRRAILGSIEASLKALRVETIDLMLIHNTTLECLQREDVLLALEDARQQGKVRFLGASAYGEAMLLEVMQRDAFQVLQLPFNLLDQGLADRVFPHAVRENIGIVVRSVFLKGALTSQISNVLPRKLAPLRERALEALKLLGEEQSNLAQVALRFCLSFTGISTLLMGVRSIAELESNLTTLDLGPFPPEIVQKLREFSMDDVDLVRPTRWGWT
jgi:aryl-alcohol dehydrogenase-like predicted oxidoreductase